MSETDSFIEEVTEEVRRDRLFGLMKKYGWIAILAVILLVGGAAFSEWRKAREQARAQDFGDSILAVLQDGNQSARAGALEAIPADGPQAAVSAMLAAREAFAAGDRDGALKALARVAQDNSLPARWRDLAVFKSALLQADDLGSDEMAAQLAGLRAPGKPYRLLADEQVALALAAEGRKDEAVSLLNAIAEDQEASSGQRRRVLQLIVALGGTPAAPDGGAQAAAGTTDGVEDSASQ